MVKMLQDASHGRYDSAIVRGLLVTVCLFPIGSYVALSDGRVGKVIRTTDQYDRPVLETWFRNQYYQPPDVVDLTQLPNADVRVIHPLARLP